MPTLVSDAGVAVIRVLVVEDVERLGALIAQGLQKSGFQSEVALSASAARLALEDGAFDVMVLDLGLPDQDGVSLLKDLRAEGHTIPVIILTTRITVGDRVTGLNAGADDYLTKPFEFDELVARLRAVLRRPAAPFSDVLTIGDLAFDSQSRVLTIGGEPAGLSAKEQMLLEHLLRRPGEVVSKIFLEDNIYGATGESATNSLEVLVHRLRSRLRDIGASVSIRTVRGVGYMIAGREADS